MRWYCPSSRLMVKRTQWVGLVLRTFYYRSWWIFTTKMIFSPCIQYVFTNWRPGQPNDVPPGEDCAEMLADGQWNDGRCGYPQAYICKKPVSSKYMYIRGFLYLPIMSPSLRHRRKKPITLVAETLNKNPICKSFFSSSSNT